MLKNPSNLNKLNRLSIVLSYILSILIAVFVFLTGGTPSAVANLMYIPIATTSSTNGKIHGVIHAIFSGIILGPLMPLHNNLGMDQITSNWAIRLAIYVVISFIIGGFADYNKRSKEYIANLLTHDSVTDLKNIEAIRRGRDFTGSHKTIIALSVAEHQEILGFFGYEFTNEAILKFSQELKNILSKYKKIELFRYDGMEFVIVVTNNDDTSNADKIIESLLSINKSTIKIDDIPIYIEVVIGITTIESDTTLLEGVRQAIATLRYAIGEGSGLEIFNNELDGHFKNLVSIASKFRIALANGNIKAAYQNIYHTDTGEIRGSELLARWVSKGEVIYNPEEFISVIEKTKLINELSKHMLNIAIDKLNTESNENFLVSINFSPSDFKDGVIDYLIDKIDKNKINPKQLLVEITEDVCVNKDEVIGYLYQLRRRRVSIAIDDFGTGYSSYQYLSELPIDIIKIDGSIIKRIEYNHVSRSLVKSIVEFSKNNNIKTIAEGVENSKVVDICKDLEIDYIQGYYCHEPTIID